ncbi:ATP synthase subunit I [Dendrosporobacter sp. 1207_IL3150]|uniref:ATP synthase subunit I n=1 Tax=Dendrosporobacter sp. 1207_IL3150 TaxID=3084054 RepID=UPI002FDA17D0
MQEFISEIRCTAAQMLLWSGLLCLFAYIAGFNLIIPGLISGTIASLAYFALAAYRIRRSADLPIDKAVRYMRIGWVIRFGFIVSILLMAVRVSQTNFWATIAGLMSFHIVIIANAIAAVLRSKLNKRY